MTISYNPTLERRWKHYQWQEQIKITDRMGFLIRHIGWLKSQKQTSSVRSELALLEDELKGLTKKKEDEKRKKVAEEEDQKKRRETRKLELSVEINTIKHRLAHLKNFTLKPQSSSEIKDLEDRLKNLQGELRRL